MRESNEYDRLSRPGSRAGVVRLQSRTAGRSPASDPERDTVGNRRRREAAPILYGLLDAADVRELARRRAMLPYVRRRFPLPMREAS